jgi:hypothetical protein
MVLLRGMLPSKWSKTSDGAKDSCNTDYNGGTPDTHTNKQWNNSMLNDCLICCMAIGIKTFHFRIIQNKPIPWWPGQQFDHIPYSLMTLVNSLSHATESPAKTPIYIITEDNIQKTVFGDSISTKHHTWKSSTHHNQLIKRIIKFASYKPFCINWSNHTLTSHC